MSRREPGAGQHGRWVVGTCEQRRRAGDGDRVCGAGEGQPAVAGRAPKLGRRSVLSWGLLVIQVRVEKKQCGWGRTQASARRRCCRAAYPRRLSLSPSWERLVPGIPGAGASELGKLSGGGGGGRLEVAWHREEGNARGSPLGLWGHTKPEELVLRSLGHGNFTGDRLAHPTTRRGVLSSQKFQSLWEAFVEGGGPGGEEGGH